MELSFFASIMNFVTTLLATVYEIPHEQYTLLCFENKNWHHYPNHAKTRMQEKWKIVANNDLFLIMVLKYNVSM